MRLSIFSSDDKKLPAGLGKTWLIAVLLFCFIMGCWEIFWRAQGYVPSIEDDLDIWQLQRSKVSEKTGVVLMGASRGQLGLHPDVFEEMLGMGPVNLCIDGNPPFSVLRDLASDPRFEGVVFCSLLPRWLAEVVPEKDRAAKWVRKYKKRSLFSSLEARVSMKLQQNFVFRYPGLSPSRLSERFAEGRWPSIPYAPMRPDRFRFANFTPQNSAAILTSRVERERRISRESILISEQAFQRRIDEVRLDVKKIQARGGDVIFIRMPSSGEIRKIEAVTWPRSTVWDRFARECAGHMIHFEDYPSLKRFECPDGSHLSGEDAARFTRNLLEILSLKAGDLKG